MIKSYRWIIDLNGNYIDTPGIKLTGFSDNTEEIVVIAPFSSLSAVSFGVGKNNQTAVSQYLSLDTDYNVSDFVEEDEVFGELDYQDIADWNIWRMPLRATAKAYISRYRGGSVYFSFRFGTIATNSKCLTDKGTFGINNLLPTADQTVGDFYECEDLYYILTTDTKNGIHLVLGKGMFVYWSEGGYWVKVNETMVTNTESVEQAVSPSFAMTDEVDEDEINYLVSFESTINDHETRIATLEGYLDAVLEGTQELDQITLANSTNDLVIHYDDNGNLIADDGEIERVILNNGSNLDDLHNVDSSSAVENDGLKKNASGVWVADTRVTDHESRIATLETFATTGYNYIGSVLYENLPTADQKVGDTYNITNDFTIGSDDYLAGTNATWNGTSWDFTNPPIPSASDIELSDTRNLETVVLANETDISNAQTDITTLQGVTTEQAKDIAENRYLINEIQESQKVSGDTSTAYGSDIVTISKDAITAQLKVKLSGLSLYSPNTFNLVSGSSNGITYTVSGNQITLSGTATADTTLTLASGLTASNKVYVNQDYRSGTSSGTITLYNNATSLNAVYSTDYSGVVTLGTTTITLVIASGSVLSSLVYKININKVTPLINAKQASPYNNNATFDTLSDANIKLQMDYWVNNGTLPNDTLQSVNFDKRLKSVGKNLIDMTKKVYDTQSVASYVKNEGYLYVKTTGLTWSFVRYYVKLKPNTEYTISATSIKISGSDDASIYLYDADTLIQISYSGVNNTGEMYLTFTTGNTGEILIKFQSSKSTATVQETTWTNVQIEQNASKTTYEAFKSTEQYFNVGENGYSVASVLDTVEERNGKYYHIQRNAQTTVSGAVAVNTTNYPLALSGGRWNNYLTAGGMESGVIGTDSTTGAGTLEYQLATYVETEVGTTGKATSFSGGTGYVGYYRREIGTYTTNFAVYDDEAIESIEHIILFEDGVGTELDVSSAVIAGDGLSFTHSGLSSGDIVVVIYKYADSLHGLATVTYYDSPYIVTDSVTSTIYKLVPTVASGVLTWTLTAI